MRTVTVFVPLVLALVGCGQPAMKPLSGYNDLWRGELRIGAAKVLPTAMSINITRDDDRAASEPPHDKRAFAEVFVEDIGPLAASGTISHYNWMELHRTTYGPIPDREFVSLEIRRVGAIISPPTAPCRAMRYHATHERLIRRLVKGVDPGDGELQLIGERRGPNLIQGIVVLKVSRQGKCTRRRKGGECDMWGVESFKKRIGFFVVERSGHATNVVHPSPGELHTKAFTFRRKAEKNGTSWSIWHRAGQQQPCR